MGLVKETSRLGADPRCDGLFDIEAAVQVIEREEDEIYEPWRIIDLHLDSRSRLSPRELRDLGSWLIREGRRIGREYTASGAPRKR